MSKFEESVNRQIENVDLVLSSLTGGYLNAVDLIAKLNDKECSKIKVYNPDTKKYTMVSVNGRMRKVLIDIVNGNYDEYYKMVSYKKDKNQMFWLSLFGALVVIDVISNFIIAFFC